MMRDVVHGDPAAAPARGPSPLAGGGATTTVIAPRQAAYLLALSEAHSASGPALA